jgi:hypothetical protein
MRAWPATLLCLPDVITSNFWPSLPSQAATWTGMRFSRKSPAVASMERQRPSLVLTATLENARVAVSSRGLASAAADGLRTTPARETVTTAVLAWATVVVAGAVVVVGAVVAAGEELAGAGEAGAAPPLPKVKS